MRLTAKQDKFAFNMAMGVLNQRESYLDAGYSDNPPVAIIDSQASNLASTGKIMERIEAYKREYRVGQIADYQERQKILSEIARGRTIDYIKDGSVTVNDEVPNVGALQEYTERRTINKLGRETVYKSVKLHNPVPAIDLLNKMEGAYQEESKNVYNTINIIVTRREGPKEREAIEG